MQAGPAVRLSLLLILAVSSVDAAAQARDTTPPAPMSAQPLISATRPGRDPGQPIDEEYTRKIREYTTESFFLSPLVDYLPASSTVPTPKAVLGDIAGARNNLPYSKEVYTYMRMLAKATPRVRVYSIGTTEEGREMIAVAVASEALLANLDQNKANLAKLADPRTINMNDAEALRIVKQTAPVYYITGAIHSPELELQYYQRSRNARGPVPGFGDIAGNRARNDGRRRRDAGEGGTRSAQRRAAAPARAAMASGTSDGRAVAKPAGGNSTGATTARGAAFQRSARSSRVGPSRR